LHLGIRKPEIWVGISGGFSDTNTLQQGRDILEVIAALRTGDGVRLLTPAGVELRGRAATAALLAGARADRMPILLGGSSRGTMATGWAMTRNFDGVRRLGALDATSYTLSTSAPHPGSAIRGRR
jgi:hypothetical protein